MYPETLKRHALVLLLVCLGTTALAAEKPPVVSVSKPNIIFILTDDQGYGDLGRHGHPLLKTPNLDRLFDQSVQLDNFHVSPSCSPTRASLLTGMHEFRNGVTHTIQPREHLHRDATILPQLLKQGGYRTGFIGKWHLGNDGGYAPQHRGFDWTSTNSGGAKKHFSPDIIRNGKRLRREGFREDLFFDEAMAFIDESDGDPFFCYLATYSPHTPLAAPEEFIAPYRGKVPEAKHATYLGMIANIDHNVGRLMKFLRERKLEKDTIVIFMNDNGVTVGLDVYNAGMRGCKCTIWHGGSRAISVWRWPGRWQPHKVDKLTAHLDVLPTLCELAAVKIPANLQPRLEGFSLLPLLESKEPVNWHDDRILFQHVARWPSGLAESHKYAMCAARQGHHLLLRSTPCDDPECQEFSSQCTTLRGVRKGQATATYTRENAQHHWGASPAGRWVLFDVKNDPGCQDDLSPSKPDLTSTLAAAYDKWWDDVFPAMIEAGGDKGEPVSRAAKPAAAEPATGPPERSSSPEAMFRRMDADEDKKVGLKEYVGFHTGTFARKDADNDGVLVFEEWSRSSFEAADVDEDGKVTSAEFRNLFIRQFQNRDENEDGKLTLDEFEN